MVDTLTFKVKKRHKVTVTFKLEAKDGGEEEYHFAAPKSAMMILPILEASEDQAVGLRGVLDWLGMGLNRWDWEQQQAAEVTDDTGAAVAVPRGPMPEDWEGPQTARIAARLRDDDDGLDIDSLSEVINGLSEQVADRPTT